jgi:hypothetical protein
MESSDRDALEAPEEALPDAPSDTRRPGNRLAVWLAVGLLVIAVAAALYSAIHMYRSEQRHHASLAAGVAPPPEPRAAGSPDAELKIEACLGPCVESPFDAFEACAKAWPDKIRAEFIPYLSPQGQQFCAEHGEDLACIFFNGQNRFTLGEGDSSREVRFSGPPGVGYTTGDLAEVLRMQMEEVYGELPPDFDEKVAAFRVGDLATSPQVDE